MVSNKETVGDEKRRWEAGQYKRLGLRDAGSAIKREKDVLQSAAVL